MKKLIFLLLFSNYLLAQTPPELNWSQNPKNGPTSGVFTVSDIIFDNVSSEFNSLPITIGNFSRTGNFNYGNDAAFDFFEEAIGANTNTFISKHNENDEVLWVKKLYGDGGFIPTAAIAVGNFFYVVGELSGTVDFNPGLSTANRTSISEKNLVIAKYDLNGFYVNSKLIGGSGLVTAHKIVNNGNKLVIIGELEGTIDFDPNSGVYNISSSGEKDGYVSVFNTNLAHQWTQQYGDIGNDAVKDVAIYGNYVYTTSTTQSIGPDCSNYSNNTDTNEITTNYTAYPSALNSQPPEFDVVLTPLGNSTYRIESGWGPNFVSYMTGNTAYNGLYPYSGTITINEDFTIDFIGDENWATGGSGEFNPCTHEFSYTLSQELFSDRFDTDVILVPEEPPTWDGPIVALDGKNQSDLVVYDITNGTVQSSTPIGSQIETPLALINNDLHINSSGEIFVMGSFQGDNRFLTYNNVRNDLVVPDILQQQGYNGYSLFISKFEPISGKVENLNANLATFGQSSFSVIGSATNEVQMYLGSEQGTTSEYYQYLDQGEIYFNSDGVVYGYDGTVDDQVLYPINSGGQAINIDEAGIYFISVNNTNGEFMLQKIPDLIMSEYEPIKNVVINSLTSAEDSFNIFFEINEENYSLILTHPSDNGLNIDINGNIFQDQLDTYDYANSVILEISLTDYQILWEKAGPPVRYLSGCELIPSTEGIFYIHNNSGDLDPRADSEDVVNSDFPKISKYTLDGEYDSSFAYNPRINFFSYYFVHNMISSSDGSKYFVGHNRAGLDFNNDNNLDIDAVPVNSKSFYIRKYNSANEFMWMKSIENLSDINPTEVNVLAIDEDSQNNLLLYGSYYGDLYFDPSSSNGLLSNPTNTNRYFMAKYSPNGDLIWAKNLVNDTPQQNFGSINTKNQFIFDNNDNMYFLVTLFSNENADPINLNPSDDSAYYINFPEANTWYSAIVKFDSDLNIVYGKLIDSKIGRGRLFSGIDNGLAVNNEVLQYQYVVLGTNVPEESTHLIDVDLSEENEILVESFGNEVLVNYNLDGEYISHHVLLSELNDPELPFHTRSSRPTVDEKGNIYTKTIYYYPLAEGGFTRPMIIRKYSPNYELQWQKTVSNNDLNRAASYPVELHSSGLIFVMSNYYNYLDLADFNLDIIYADTENSWGTAIVALSSDNGELTYLKNYPNNTSRVDFSVSDEELLVSGNFTNQLELDFDSNAVNYTTYNSSSEQFYASYLFSESLSIDSNVPEINWTVYPNPTPGEIIIQISSHDFSELYNALGQKILISKSPNISLSNLKAGLYFLKVFDKSGREFTKKIIKK